MQVASVRRVWVDVERMWVGERVRVRGGCGAGEREGVGRRLRVQRDAAVKVAVVARDACEVGERAGGGAARRQLRRTHTHACTVMPSGHICFCTIRAAHM